MNIASWLHHATREIAGAGIASAKLDAEIILAHTLRKGRTFLHAHSDDELDDRQIEIADARLRLRCDRTPIAYIIGHKDFYGRRFRVTPATLIPRPESETMIDLLLEIQPKNTSLLPETPKRLVDVGTGSGILGITAKLLLPDLDITLLDVSNHALNVAEANAKMLDADVATIKSDLLTQYPFTPDYILANLPYVDPTWDRSPETDYEPSVALFAADDGLALIYKLIDQSAAKMKIGGYLLLEADPRQHPAIITAGKATTFTLEHQQGFIVVLRKTS